MTPPLQQRCKRRKVKIYLSGPMTGIKEENRPAFAEAAACLRGHGHVVMNPGEHVDGLSYREYLRLDCNWICEHADAVAFLPGWRESKGANAELAIARALDLTVYIPWARALCHMPKS